MTIRLCGFASFRRAPPLRSIFSWRDSAALVDDSDAAGRRADARREAGAHAALFFFTRSESNCFALSSFALRAALRFFPARFTKNVSMRIPEPGPFGETLFEASARAIVSGSFVKSLSGGYVDTVFTLPDHFLAFFAWLAVLRFAIFALPVLVLPGQPALSPFDYGAPALRPNFKSFNAF
jgi:hypothetical protein